MNPLELLASHTSFKGEQRLYRHYADSLHRPLEVAIYLPVASLLKERPCAALYYLPGLQTNARLVASQSDYQRYANRYDTILVIPDLFNVYQGDDIARTDQYTREHQAIAAYLQDELPATLAAHFALAPGRGIMGSGFGGTLAIYHARPQRLGARAVAGIYRHAVARRTPRARPTAGTLRPERLVRRASGRTAAAAMDRPRHGRRPSRQQNPPRRL